MKAKLADIIVVIPGIGGSTLQRHGTDLWALSPGAALRGILSRGRSIKDLALSSYDDWRDDLYDGVKAVALLPDLHIIPGLRWKIDGYRRLRRHLFDRFDLTTGLNYFEFPYDWRRDNRAAARQLAERGPLWLESWRSYSGNNEAKLVLVCHSMGGVVARIFLELMGGWRHTRTLITFGTPYSGSVNAVDFLVNGFGKKLAPLDLIGLSDTLRSFTSVYQLLPSYRCLDIGQAQLAYLDEGPPIANINPSRMSAALALHREVRATVDAHRRTNYEGTGGYEIRPIVGDFQPSAQSVHVDGSRVAILRTRGGQDEGGDGTVAKVSAVPHELLSGWVNAAFFSDHHASLQNSPGVATHLAGVIRSHNIATAQVFAANAQVSLAVEDVYLTGERIVVGARLDRVGPPLKVSIRALAHDGPSVDLRLEEGQDDWQQATSDPLPDGDYRVTVGALEEAGVDPATDIISVVDLRAINQSAKARRDDPKP